MALAETTWVLHRAYGHMSAEIRTIVAGLLDSTELVVERSDVVRAALTLDAPQFSDALVAELGRAAGVDETVTFDKRAAALPGMRLLS